jgi:hypothetical protein
MSHHHNHEHRQGHSQSDGQKSSEVLAYHLWEQAGRPEGQAARFWEEAEEQIKRATQPAAESLSSPHGRHGHAH